MLALSQAPRGNAFTIPPPIQVDAGALGFIDVSGGADGYFYYLAGTRSKHGTSANGLGDTSSGIQSGSFLISLQTQPALLQATLEVGSHGGTTALGTPPFPSSVNIFSTGPLHAAYLTLAPPHSPCTFSVGQIGSIEGYENGEDWDNANALTTEIFYTESGDARGFETACTTGPLATLIFFSDGYNTGVFNFLQILSTYTLGANSNLNFFYGGNLGVTGINAHTYGEDYAKSTVGAYGAYYDNSQLFGIWLGWTHGNLNLLPEIQYQFARADHRIALRKFSSNFGAALFAAYAFPGSPYALGAWAEAWTSNGPDNWFIAPASSGAGISLAPAWQTKNLYVEPDFGLLYLKATSNAYARNFGYGANGSQHLEFTVEIDAGFLF